MAVTEPIAIIGMSGRFPGSASIDELWKNLAAGRDCIGELDDEELLRYQEDPELIARQDYVRKRPTLSDSDSFDAELFGMTPREAEVRDPQYRVLLETVHGTLEHAGYDPATYPGQIGLFAGTNVNRYRYDYIERRRDVVNSIGFLAIDVANHPDYLSTYISYKLGLRGPSATVLTACSTSLFAVHLAGNAIRAGDCDMAVAGGVDLEFPYHRGYVPLPGGIAAKDGFPRAFDANATGTNFGDGVGAVLLKRLSAAQRDGDTIYAVIRASSVNNDGNRKVGYTAPSVSGQSECIQRALTQAGVSPRDIDYLEAHGTATRVGDPIELTGLIDAYRAVSTEPLPAQYCAIASVKSNIGHLGQAAGVAALIKATLALNHGQIPPSINMTTPTPGVDWANSPFYVNTELRDWPKTPGRPRLAGVSSFGIGGTNAHLILAEAPETPVAPAPAEDEILLWSAVTETAADALRERLAEHFDNADPARFADAAHTLRVGRTARPIRGAVRASDPADAAIALRTPNRIIRADGGSRSVAFAFPGQGGLHPGAAHELYQRESVFREGCDAAFEVLRPLLGIDLRDRWLTATDPAELADTGIAQPLLFTLEYALAHSLMHWGVEPELLFGHSLGELAAAAVAGVFDFESGLRAVAARAKAMAAMPPGRMLAVATSPDDLQDLLSSDVALAAVNGPNQTVLAGPADALAEVAATLAGQGITSKELATSHAFHSPSMAPAIDEFAATLAELTLHEPDIPLLTSTTGTRVTDEQATSVDFWTRQLIEPVRFDRTVGTVFGQGAVTVLEVGPGRTLTALLRPGARADDRVLTCAPQPAAEGKPKPQGLTDVLARLWVDGVPITYWQDREATGRRRVAVPGYPYQRRRYWLDRQTTPAPAVPKPEPVAAPQRPEEPLAAWEFAHLTWTPDTAAPTPHSTLASAAGAAVLLAPADPVAARLAQAALQRAGFRTTKLTDLRTGDAANAIDPTSVDDWIVALDKQAQAGQGTLLVGHAALLTPATGPADQRLADTLATLHAALRAAAQAQRRHRVPTRIVLFGRGLVDVTGAETIDPAAAAAVALVRTAEQENPGLRCQIVDLANASEDLLSTTIADPARPLVALRGRQRWLPGLAPIDSGSDPGGLLRPRGTYLITGGLGGVGIVVARALAETGLGLRLALLGRTGLDGLSEPDHTRVRTELDALIDAGADVEVLSCDVADPVALAAAVDVAQARFGPINGVIHSAGIAGGGLLERRTAEEIAAVLRPKVSGVRAIEEVFADRMPLDFLMLFSSQAGLSGLYGSADYAAANAFLDAHARGTAGSARRTISVQWPGWSEVGMLARSPEAHTVLATPAPQPDREDAAFRAIRTPDQDWEFDEHVFEGVPVLPGTALLEFAVQAAYAAGLPGDGRALELRGTAFLAPVVGDGPRQVRVLLSPMANVHRFRVQARPAGSNEPWTDHATGTVGATDPVAAPALPDLQERLPTKTKSGLAGWIKFGPRWATITTTSGSEHERLARLVLPEEYHADFADHPVHPALLDVAAGVLTDLTAGKAYAPFLYRRIVVQDKLTPDLTVHARFTAGGKHPRPVDFDIYDTPTGRLLLRAEAFTMRVVAPQSGFSPTPQAKPYPAPGLLSPTDGSQAFLTLLDPATPPVVLVDLPANRLAVAGIPRLGLPAQPELPPPPAPAPIPAPRPAAKPQLDDDVLGRLRALWGDALGVSDIPTDADFFDLGGNSLAAVQLAARISAAFSIELSAGTLFDASTIDALAEEIRALTT